MNVTEPKILNFLETVGIYISQGQISEMLHQEIGRMHAEKEEIYQAGLQSTPWQQTDDTGIRVNGQNQHLHIVCNPFYTAYFTKPRKDRLTVLQVLWAKAPLLFCLNDLAFAYLAQYSVSKANRALLAGLPQEQMFSQTEFEMLLEEHLPELSDQQLKWVLEAAAIAAYHTQVCPELAEGMSFQLSSYYCVTMPNSSSGLPSTWLCAGSMRVAITRN